MISDREIYQTAQVVIKKYGDDALIEAALRQDKLSAEGDQEGARVWKRIADAIEFLQIPKTLSDRSVH